MQKNGNSNDAGVQIKSSTLQTSQETCKKCYIAEPRFYLKSVIKNLLRIKTDRFLGANKVE